jgi:hypothetical protein
MDNSIATALISGGGSVLAAITALILSHRGFVALEGRLTSIEGRFDSFDNRFGSIERRFDMLQADMRNLNKRMMALTIDLALVRKKVSR